MRLFVRSDREIRVTSDLRARPGLISSAEFGRTVVAFTYYSQPLPTVDVNGTARFRNYASINAKREPIVLLMIYK